MYVHMYIVMSNDFKKLLIFDHFKHNWKNVVHISYFIEKQFIVSVIG